MTGLVKILRHLFNEKKQLTLNEIYEVCSRNEQIKLAKNVLKHRIRSCLYSLKKNGEIKRISDSTYQRI